MLLARENGNWTYSRLIIGGFRKKSGIMIQPQTALPILCRPQSRSIYRMVKRPANVKPKRDKYFSRGGLLVRPLFFFPAYNPLRPYSISHEAKRSASSTLGVFKIFEKSSRFYRDGLGFPVENLLAEWYYFLQALEGITLALYPRDKLAEDATLPNTGFRIFRYHL